MFENAYPEKVPNLKKHKSEYSPGVHERFFFYIATKVEASYGASLGFHDIFGFSIKKQHFWAFFVISK